MWWHRLPLTTQSDGNLDKEVLPEYNPDSTLECFGLQAEAFFSMKNNLERKFFELIYLRKAGYFSEIADK
jgi:hypothetical protein